MPFTIAVEPGLIRMTVTGVFSDEDLRGMGAAATEIEERTSPIPARITNLTGSSELQISYAGVHAFAAQRRTIAFPNAFKSAIVVAGATQLGMARMFQTLNDNPQITIEIFTDEASALAWARS